MGINRFQLTLASRNENKLHELRVALPDWQLELLDTDEDFPPELGAAYLDNARSKARFGREVTEPGTWVLGEDSGIEVFGLGGRPGPESARFGGDDPVGRLLEELRGFGEDGRRAQYVCELVLLSPETEFRGTGVLEGRIGDEPRGLEGFGYDPIFIPDGEQRTVAELGNDWKREHSHRARAAKALGAAVSSHRS